MKERCILVTLGEYGKDGNWYMPNTKQMRTMAVLVDSYSFLDDVYLAKSLRTCILGLEKDRNVGKVSKQIQDGDETKRSIPSES